MKYCIFFIIIGIALSNCNRKFNNYILFDAEKLGEIDKPNPNINYYDSPSKSYYLLTFYRTNEKIVGEDFSFESVNTYKNHPDVDATEIVQNIALYFFSDGGVVFHTPYITETSGNYSPLPLESFKDLHKIENPRANPPTHPLEEKLQRSIMQGYQLKQVNKKEVVKVVAKSENIKGDTVNRRAEKNELDNYKNATKVDSSKKNYKIPIVTNNVVEIADMVTDLKIYLERRKKKFPLILVGKHIPLNPKNREAILIESIFFHKEINSSSGKYTQATMDQTFNLGNISQSDSSKSLLWFRLVETKR